MLSKVEFDKLIDDSEKAIARHAEEQEELSLLIQNIEQEAKLGYENQEKSKDKFFEIIFLCRKIGKIIA